MKNYQEPTMVVTTFDSEDVVMASVFGAFSNDWLNVFDESWTGEDL